MMKKKNWYTYTLLLFVSTMLIAIPVIPHHHHGNGIICMKDDAREVGCCSHHHTQQHQEDDPCCNGDCATQILISVPSIDTGGIQPEFAHIHILYTESLLRFITQPPRSDAYGDYVYLESLHGTYLTRAAELRAPPVL